MTSPFTPSPVAAGWETVAPAEAGFNPAKLAAATAFAEGAESPWPMSLYYPDGRYVGIVEWNETGPWSAIVGPVIPRGKPAGVIVKGGRIAASWGDVSRVDMTFSIAKSYLAVLAGLAVDDGLIRLDDPVAKTVDGPHFASAHNAKITWRHLLTQASEWEGVIFEKSDQVDHNRQIGAGADNSRKGEKRELREPGTFYEYNDVRVNVLSYALLRRFDRALPEVLKERIMDPIGASDTWRWHGYENSWVDLGNGRKAQSVPGGAHWGGGIFISALDHARLGLLIGRQGEWGGRQLLSKAYIAEMLAPSATNPDYGFLWWLNRGKARYPAATERSVFALGAGSNIIWVEPENDLVVVGRWADQTKFNTFFDHVMGALA
ncbi:serine hydrolase domain-containing protein [Phreatobacter oligotrophus]|uniref:CubicO group peptidase (Beta-lactamase class C family) n=1 Tax=Phreatobacter oligotrophus TaxID=1122261 RepID=A0A2T4Z383_9HYPH|nr:serine hydrolase [Phreatobacter oligotrophus]PTM55230.1 CubicO group peptidase (beta-lactamase class C family) [Phreatobacter oligotrophus]